MENMEFVIFLAIAVLLLFMGWCVLEIVRSKRLVKIAEEMGFTFKDCLKKSELHFPQSKLFEVESSSKQYINVMSGQYKEAHCDVFGFAFWDSSGEGTTRIVQTVFVFTSEREFQFVECISGEKNQLFLLENIPEALDIVMGNTEFDSNYRLQGSEVKLIKKWFRKAGADVMLSTRGSTMAWQGNMCMFYTSGKRVPAKLLKDNIDMYYKAFKELESALP